MDTERGLFATWEALVFLKDIQVHVVAHVAFGCFLQRLVVPGKIAAVAQGFVDYPATGLRMAHGGVELGKVPAGSSPGSTASADVNAASADLHATFIFDPATNQDNDGEGVESGF